MLLADAGEWPLYALDRAALGRSIVNHFVQMIGTLAYGRNREVTANSGFTVFSSEYSGTHEESRKMTS